MLRDLIEWLDHSSRQAGNWLVTSLNTMTEQNILDWPADIWAAIGIVAFLVGMFIYPFVAEWFDPPSGD